MAKRRPYRFFLYLLARGAALPFYWLPRRAALFLGAKLGEAVFLIVGRQRRMTLEHLRLAWGNEKSPAEIETIARSVFENAEIGRAHV